jgi:ABC-type Mn2+/Zn2+ transport system ATPase subunit
MQVGETVFDIRKAGVRYGREGVLESVSCRISAGEFVGLAGPNGAGKTTLLRALLGLIPLAEGEILRGHGKIGYVSQRSWHASNVPISVIEVVALGAAGDKEKARTALAKVDMEAAVGKRFSELSGGQQQRVGIAKALAGRADVMVLDEPTTGIDGRGQEELHSLLRALWRQGKTIIMVSHDIAAMRSLVSRVIYLNRTILYDGAPEKFLLPHSLEGSGHA